MFKETMGFDVTKFHGGKAIHITDTRPNADRELRVTRSDVAQMMSVNSEVQVPHIDYTTGNYLVKSCTTETLVAVNEEPIIRYFHIADFIGNNPRYRIKEVGYTISFDKSLFTGTPDLKVDKSLNTMNDSFVKTSIELKGLGVVNHKFFLKLYDEKLWNVDPWGSDLSEEMKHRIGCEVMVNPWYFLSFARLPDVTGGYVQYELNLGNLATTFCILNNINHYSTFPRQLFKNGSYRAIFSWLFNYGMRNSSISFSDKSLACAQWQLELMVEMSKMVPAYLQQNMFLANVKTGANLFSNNQIIAKPSATSALNAEKIGRGNDSHIQFFNEIDFVKFNKILLESSAPVFSKKCKEEWYGDRFASRVLTSTPGPLDTESGRYMFEFTQKALEWNDNFYDLEPHELRRIIEINSPITFVYIEKSYQQLRQDADWFNRQSMNLFDNKEMIRRELLLERF